MLLLVHHVLRLLVVVSWHLALRVRRRQLAWVHLLGLLEVRVALHLSVSHAPTLLSSVTAAVLVGSSRSPAILLKLLLISRRATLPMHHRVSALTARVLLRRIRLARRIVLRRLPRRVTLHVWLLEVAACRTAESAAPSASLQSGRPGS